jgi:3'-phosphoadenosine 5'-phosphosulfate sulfotransferase (PAPS reductase)/FAD synthetase
MNRYISFSGGVESTTMCLLFGKGAKAIWADTKSEHEKMYDRINEVEGFLKDYHDGDFGIVKVVGQAEVGGKSVEGLTDYILASKFFPSPRARFCTRKFKIEPIDKYLSAQGEVELMIGLNYDERDDRTGNFGLQSNVNYTYPLVDIEYDRATCSEILEHYGIHPDFPPYMDRGGCKFCPFKSRKEYKAMVHFAPDEIEEVARIEETIQDARNKYFRIRSNMPRLRDFISLEKNNLIGNLSGFYAADSERKSCGVFCHR